MGVKMVTVESVDLMPGQQGRREKSAPPEMVVFVLWVLTPVTLEAVGRIEDGKLGNGPRFETAGWLR